MPALTNKGLAFVVSMAMTSGATAQEPVLVVTRVAYKVTDACRFVDRESSIAIEAVDQEGKPASGIEIAAVSKEYGREQAIRLNATGRGKLWLRRNQPYFLVVDRFGGAESSLPVAVALGCEISIRVEVERRRFYVIY